jgi:hypothetical protein
MRKHKECVAVSDEESNVEIFENALKVSTVPTPTRWYDVKHGVLLSL